MFAGSTITAPRRFSCTYALSRRVMRGHVRCADPERAAKVAVDTLTALKAELIVGLTHQSVESDRDLLAAEPRIDLILGGHEHEALDPIARIAGPRYAKLGEIVTLKPVFQTSKTES